LYNEKACKPYSSVGIWSLSISSVGIEVSSEGAKGRCWTCPNAVVTAAGSACSSDDRTDGALVSSETGSLAGTHSNTTGVSSGPLVGLSPQLGPLLQEGPHCRPTVALRAPSVLSSLEQAEPAAVTTALGHVQQRPLAPSLDTSIPTLEMGSA